MCDLGFIHFRGGSIKRRVVCPLVESWLPNTLKLYEVVDIQRYNGVYACVRIQVSPPTREISEKIKQAFIIRTSPEVGL